MKQQGVMKRIVYGIGILAGMMTLASVARAADDVEFKNSGEFRVRYFNDANSTGLDNSGQRADTTARLKWNLSARKGENLQAFVTLMNNSMFGAANQIYGGETSSTVTAPAQGSVTANNTILVSRAWGWWKATDALNFKVGRIGIEVADGAVFAENDWYNVPTTFEGLQATWDANFAKMNFFAIKTNEFSVANPPQAGAPSNDPEANFYLISADIKNMPEAIKLANIHVVQFQRDQTVGAAAAQNGSMNMQQFGLTISGDWANVLYRGTASFQTGSWAKTDTLDMKAAGQMFDVMLGYGIPDSWGLKATVGYHMDSGEEPSTDKHERYYAPYYDRHNYAGLMDVLKWGNLTYWDINASIQPRENLEIGLGYYMFSRSQTSDTVVDLGDRYVANKTGFGNATGAAGEKDLGSEVDLYASKTYDGGFNIGARLGAFMPGSFMKSGSPVVDKTLLQGMLQASMPF